MPKVTGIMLLRMTGILPGTTDRQLCEVSILYSQPHELSSYKFFAQTSTAGDSCNVDGR